MKIEYYVGVLPEDIDTMNSFINELNSSIDEDFNVEVVGQFDDPNGYYSYTIKGTWKSYQAFLDKTDSFVKSVEHFEED